MRELARKQTKAELTYGKLKADILSGRLSPDQRLIHADLCETYEVGVGILREVLPRLVERGLAVSEPQLGFRVAPLSEHDLRELTEARLTIEPLLLRRSIESGDLAWEGAVLAAHHELKQTSQSGGDGSITEEWIKRHTRFHEALFEACPNRRLVEMADKLREEAERYHYWMGSQPPPEPRARDLEREHRDLAELSIARDADRAAEILTDHIRQSDQMALQALENAKSVG